MFRRFYLLALAIICTAVTAVAGSTFVESPLADAAMNGNRDVVRALLQQHADVNAAQGDGTTALHWAVYRDDADMASLLIAAGANVIAKTRVGSITPMFMAAKNGNATIIQMLLKAGVNPNSTDTNGTTALMYAAISGKPEATKVLLDHGANANARDFTNGQTAMMFAAS